MSGRLSLVAVPIGNADDLTIRALRTLATAHVVAAEDTRTTMALLEHHGVKTRLVSFHDHNEASRTADLLDRVSRGEHVAVVSEAGTPLVNDPGFRLVREAIQRGVEIDVLPGACAAITALVGAGLPVDRWMYAGFFPRSPGDRKKLVDELVSLQSTLIFYESPLRLADTLHFLGQCWPDRQICVARNLTKIHQQWLRGTAAEVVEALGSETRGEVVLLVGPPVEAPLSTDPAGLVQTLLARGLNPREVRDAVAEAAGLSKRDAYRLVLGALDRA